MQKRAVRLIFLALLLVTGIGAGYFTWDTYRRVSDVLEREREIDARLDRMLASVSEVGAAQQAYVAPGQARAEWFSRVSSHVQQLYDDSAALSARARSTDAAAALRGLGESLDALVSSDTRVREHLRVAQELMAADLVYSEARQMVDGMAQTLRELQAAERATALDERQAMLAQGGAGLGLAALIWFAGLFALARVPREAAPLPPSIPAVSEPPPALPNVADVSAAAQVCTDLSRLGTASELPALLARAAGVLDAAGIIVWLGAGEQLFAATAHGYDSRMLGRLGPIPRDAENATAAAWRTSEIRTVPADMMAHGAIVAPLSGPDGCFGVLAAEVRQGREADETTRALTAIFAAQLATIVAAWPQPSTGADTAAPAEGGSVPDAGATAATA